MNKVEKMNARKFAQRGAKQDCWPKKQRRNHEGMDRNISSTKIKIFSFQGKNDPYLYLEWE